MFSGFCLLVRGHHCSLIKQSCFIFESLSLLTHFKLTLEYSGQKGYCYSKKKETASKSEKIRKNGTIMLSYLPFLDQDKCKKLFVYEAV